MPKAMEKKLKAEARKKGLKGKRAYAYIYGTMRKAGWKPEKTASKRTKGTRRKVKARS